MSIFPGRTFPQTTLKLLLLLVALLLMGCSNDPPRDTSGREIVTVWHHTGRPAEKQVMQEQVRLFNKRQNEITIRLTLIPEGEYNTQVQAAATDNNLPDLLDLDGPYLANYAWKNHLTPLEDLLRPEVKKDILPSLLAQGTYNKKLFAIGTFDSGLGLYGNRQMLKAIAARLPAGPKDSWSHEEFAEILARLAQKDEDGMVLDLRLDYRGEWYTYAFSPLLQSAGADLIDRRTMQSAALVLNSPAALRALGQVQSWFKKGFIEPNTDSSSFTTGRTALSWCGHWEYPRYKKALGNNLILLPLPDFGTGTKTGMGSWAWAIPRASNKKTQAMRFLHYLLEPEQILKTCEANGAIPGTRTAIIASPLYQPGGPLHLFVRQLSHAVPRPQTPAYPVITSAFQQVFADVRHGADITEALNRAVALIDQDIQDNEGYPIISK